MADGGGGKSICWLVVPVEGGDADAALLAVSGWSPVIFNSGRLVPRSTQVTT